MSNIAELTRRIRKSAENRTHEERVKLLKDAHIIDSNGSVDKFFTTITLIDADNVRSNPTVSYASSYPKAG